MVSDTRPHAVKDSHSASVISVFLLTNLVFVSGLLSGAGNFLLEVVFIAAVMKSISSKFSRTRRQFNLDFMYSCEGQKKIYMVYDQRYSKLLIIPATSMYVSIINLHLL